MKVFFNKLPVKSMIKIASYIESQNTPGSGLRWLTKVRAEIQKIADSKAVFAICRYQNFSKHGYRCFTYNDWVVAYKVVRGEFVIYRFAYGPKLK